MKRSLTVSIALLSLFFAQPLTAQTSEQVTTVPNDLQNPLTLLFHHEASARQVVLATGEMICDNLLVMGWNVIVADRDWAKVNLKTMEANLHKSWIWDNNTFFMNQIGHPYHGSLYFTSARSNNLNWLESFAVAATGSLMWELFMEVGSPSMNDFITTTTSGAVIGEILHRLSFEAYDVLPLFSWIISPVNAITQLVTGDRARRPVGTTWRNDWFLYGGLSTTAFQFSSAENNKNEIHGPLVGFGFDVIYNNPYGHNSQELYDQFRVQLDVFTASRYRFFRLLMDGTLYALSLEHLTQQPTTVGLTFNYDIFDVENISLSAGSAGLAFRQQNTISDAALRWNLEADYIFMGVPDIYFKLNSDSQVTIPTVQPPYTYRNGPEARAGLEFTHPVAGTFALDAQTMVLWAYPDTSHDTRFDGLTLIAHAQARYEHEIWNNISLGVSDLFYFKHEWFNSPEVPDTTQITNTIRIYAKFSLRQAL